MKKNGIKKIMHFTMLILTTTMFFAFPVSKSYSSIGSFATNTSAIVAADTYSTSSGGVRQQSIYAVATAVAASYVSGIIVGKVAHHVYDFMGGHPKPDKERSISPNNNFTVFDN